MSRYSRYAQLSNTAPQASAVTVTTTDRGQALRKVINHKATGPRKTSKTASGLYAIAPTTSPLKRDRHARVVPQHGHGKPVTRRKRQKVIPAACPTRTMAPSEQRASATPKASLLEKTLADGTCLAGSVGN